MLKFSPWVALTLRIPFWSTTALTCTTPEKIPPPWGARQKLSPRGSVVLRASIATSPPAHVQSRFTAQLVLMRDDRPAVHLRFTPGPGSTSAQVPAGVGAGVESVTVTLMPVVQLWVVSRSQATVPHCLAAGFAPTRVGMLAQSLMLELLWSVGCLSDHWK